MPKQFSPLLLGGLAALSMVLPPLIQRPVKAQSPPSGSFIATQACPATRAINGENPGNVELAVNQTYEAIGFNRPQGPYILLKIPGANPDRRWVSVDCGTFQAGQSPMPSPSPTTPTGTEPTPRRRTQNIVLFDFFDGVNNPISMDFPRSAQKDISPLPPKLQPFDRRVLQICGSTFNAPVDPAQFRRLLRDYPDVVRRLKQVTGGQIKPGRQSNTEFVEDVTAIWFDQNGFKHIFCGEKDGKSIGGLHYVGRYLELQEKGIAGRINRTSDGRNSTEEVVDGAIYTFGVAIIAGDRIVAEHPIKGYPYASNALKILLDATRAYTLFKATGDQGSVACLYTVTDPGVEPFQAVFVKKQRAIRTYYPDATPDTSRNKPCN